LQWKYTPAALLALYCDRTACCTVRPPHQLARYRLRRFDTISTHSLRYIAMNNTHVHFTVLKKARLTLWHQTIVSIELRL